MAACARLRQRPIDDISRRERGVADGKKLLGDRIPLVSSPGETGPGYLSASETPFELRVDLSTERIKRSGVRDYLGYVRFEYGGELLSTDQALCRINQPIR